MKNYLLLFAFVLTFGVAQAVRPMPALFKNQVSHPMPMIKSQAKTFTSGTLSDGGNGIQHTDIYAPGGWDSDGSFGYTALTSGSGGTLSATDYNGTTYSVSWSLSGTTIYWSVYVVPGSSDVDLDIHDLIIADDSPNANTIYVSEDYEGEDYGSGIWSASGSAGIDPNATFLSFNFLCQGNSETGSVLPETVVVYNGLIVLI